MEKPSALIVEDERDIAALFRHVLDIAGYQTDIATDGREAVKRLRSKRPDIVLLDLFLPGISGVKILEQMRSDPELAAIPVVVITAHPQAADGLPIEPDLVLLKPVNLDQLSNLVQRLRTSTPSSAETPWDHDTHLYNRSFFTMRLGAALERATQLSGTQFGVLFLDVEPFLRPEQTATFIRDMASRLKTAIRPTDTIARFSTGLFLVLIEDFPYEDILTKITGRLQLEFANYLSQTERGAGLSANVGALLCDAAYTDAEEILDDIEQARRVAQRDGDYILYRRDMFKARRGS